MPDAVLTIGYQGSTIRDFVAALKSADVQVLIDVRAISASRKRGFSKKMLSATLEAAEIGYVHLRDLGNPKPGREAARRGDAAASERIYRAHLASPEAQKALAEARDIARDARACLLCFERDHAGCHRTIVAKEIAPRLVEHLSPPAAGRDGRGGAMR